MAKFNSEKDNIEFEIKPIEVRDHLCGRYVNYKASLRFETGTCLALPDIFDDGNLQTIFSSSLDDTKETVELCYNNNSFSYLNEPVYQIKLNYHLLKREISQPSLFSENIFFTEQSSLFSEQELKPTNRITFEVTIRKHFKSDCCWEDLIDYVITQQSLAKIVNNRTKTKLIIGIENGNLNDLLMGHEYLEQPMTVYTRITFTQNLEDFRTSIFQLSKELESITPKESTFLDGDATGQRRFDMGPVAKPFIDTRRIKRLEELSQKLDEIFSIPKQLQKSALFNISAQIEYLLSEEIRKTLRNIFAKFPDKDSELKALQNSSEEISRSIPEISNDEELIDAILNCKIVQDSITGIILKARSTKEIITTLTRISEETSLKKLLKLITII